MYTMHTELAKILIQHIHELGCAEVDKIATKKQSKHGGKKKRMDSMVVILQ